jgi:hypothetical protein
LKRFVSLPGSKKVQVITEHKSRSKVAPVAFSSETQNVKNAVLQNGNQSLSAYDSEFHPCFPQPVPDIGASKRRTRPHADKRIALLAFTAIAAC